MHFDGTVKFSEAAIENAVAMFAFHKKVVAEEVGAAGLAALLGSARIGNHKGNRRRIPLVELLCR